MHQMLQAGYGAAPQGNQLQMAQLAQLGLLPGMQQLSQPQPQLAQQMAMQQAMQQQAQLAALGIPGLQSLLPPAQLPAAQVDPGVLFRPLPLSDSTAQDEPSTKRRKTGKACWYYMRGLCRNSDQCTWQHDAEMVAEAQLVEDQASDVPAWKTQFCRFWLKEGTCRFAQYCLYAHSEPELRTKTDSLATAVTTALQVHVPQLTQPPATAAEALLAGFDMSAASMPAANTAGVDTQWQAALQQQQLFSTMVPNMAAPPLAVQPQFSTQSMGDIQQYLAQIAALGQAMS